VYGHFTLATGWNVVSVSAPERPADLPAWSERVRALLSRGGVVICDLSGVRGADLGVIDALARLQLTARRAHARLLLTGLNGDLRDLWEWTGLP
jgi:ABC-type transporter Mla MlaB component